MQLSKHFSLSEFTASGTAWARHIDNTPPPELMPRLILVAEMLERIRSTLNVPITVTSAYRCEALNKAVGGVPNSDHTRGHAADIVAPLFGPPYQVAKALAPLVSTLGIGQLILEGVKGKQWVHVSTHTPEKPTNRILTITDAGPAIGIQAIA
jgi:hypothetical protein